MYLPLVMLYGKLGIPRHDIDAISCISHHSNIDLESLTLISPRITSLSHRQQGPGGWCDKPRSYIEHPGLRQDEPGIAARMNLHQAGY